ncbi:hypothetical protein EDD11_003155 [Mortierella claussenii]|nr:hypothetical protein EDD11_003155 [Mortierella claussenii]
MPSTNLRQPESASSANSVDDSDNQHNIHAVAKMNDSAAHGPSTLDINCPAGREALGKSIDRSITPNHEPRVFFFDIDNCLYSKNSGIPELMREKIEQYFKDVGFESSKDEKVDGALPLEELLHENIPLRNMINSLKIEKKWLFTNAGKNHALRVIKVLGLEGCFDGLTYCDYLEPNFVCKPEAEAFHRAMRDAGVVHASNCYLVDDSAANVDKALDIGWTAVHVADDPEVSKFGHFQISDILELPKVLPEFWAEDQAPEATSA